MSSGTRAKGKTVRAGAILALAVAAALAPCGAAWGAGMGLEEADRLIGMGQKAREDGLYEFAEKKLEAAAEGAPERHREAMAQLELAKTALAEGDAAKALERLDAAGEPPGGLAVEYALTRAEALAAAGDTPGALAALDELPPEPGDDAAGRAAGLRTRLLVRAGRLEEAIRACEKAEALLGTTETTGGHWLELAGALWERGEREGAAAVLERLSAAEWPADVRARAEASSLAGDARWAAEKGDAGALEEALAALKAWCEGASAGGAAPQETLRWGWERLAEAYAAAGEWGGAGEAAGKALALAGSAAEEREDRLMAARAALWGGDTEGGASGMRAAAAEMRAAGETAKAASAQFELARALAGRGDWAGAEREWRTWLEAFPGAGAGDGAGEAEAWRGLAESLGAQERGEESAWAWREALSRAGETADKESLVSAGEALAAAGDADGARAALERALGMAKDAEAWNLRYRLAELSLAAGDTSGGEMQLRALSRATGEGAGQVPWTAAMRLGALYEERRADEAAAAEYGRIAASENAAPALRAAARLAQGLVHYRMGAYLEALGDFRAVSVASPAGGPGVQAEFMQAWCLSLLGKDAEALAACQAFLSAHPDSEFAPDARFWIGEQSFNNGDWAAAEKAFSGLAEAHPDSAAAPEAMYWAGMAAARASEYLLANERFNALLAGWPGHPRTEAALLAQGDVLAELGQFPAAILAFDEVLRTFPHGEGAMAAWGRKGDCLYTLGETEPARREEALLSYRALHDFADAPEDLHLQAGYKIGRCLESMGHEAEAAEQYMETVYEYLGRREASGEDAEGWAGSAAGGIAGGRPESGVWFTRSAFAAGALLERMGRKSEALGVYRRVAESGAPAAPEAVERARRLEGERGGGAAGGN